MVVQTVERVALLAAELSMAHKLHALDVLIYSTALEHDAELVTGTVDAHFKGLPQVNYTPKQTMQKATGPKNSFCCRGLG